MHERTVYMGGLHACMGAVCMIGEVCVHTGGTVCMLRRLFSQEFDLRRLL